jgi:RNA polymerase sigma-70 factor (ECF subfamily)
VWLRDARHDQGVVAVRIDDGLVTGLYAVRNPEKLSHMEQVTALHR